MTTILVGGSTGLLAQEAFTNPDGTVLPVATTTQKIVRDTFSGSAINATKWSIVQVGTGMVPTVSGGQLSVAMGTTSGDEYHLVSTDTYQSPFRVMVGISMSQRIAGNQVFVELVSVDPTTLLVDERNVAAWRFDGVTATQAIYEVAEDGMTRLSSGASTVVTTASTSLVELELFNDECYFHSKAIDSTAARANSYVRQTQIPDPGARYRVRLRMKNTSAPATPTNAIFTICHVNDYQELVSEISSGRGSSVAGQGIGVNVNTMPTTTVTSASGDNAAATNPLMAGVRSYTTNPTTVTTSGNQRSLLGTNLGAAVTKQFSIPEADWTFVGPIAGLTTAADTAAKAAGAAGIRNYVTAVQVQNTSATASEFQIKDGATVVWRCLVPANVNMMDISFPTPLRGTAATVLNIQAVTAASVIVANVQGFQAP